MHRYHWEAKLGPRLEQVAERVQRLRRSRLPDAAQEGLRHWLRVQHAFHSNAIAGSRLTLPETRALLEGTTLLGKSFKEATEAANLAQALDFIESLASARMSLGERDIRNLHAIVLGPLEPTGAGVYRSQSVPSRGGGLAPPEPAQLPERMREFSAWLASEQTEPPVVVACTALAWFDALHPFTDGNGRTGRLLASLLLLRHRYPLTGPRVKDRARYGNALRQAHGGDLTSLVGLTLDGLEQALARCEYLAREVEASERPAPPRAPPPGPPDPREFPAWRRGAESLLEALEQVARQLTEKRSGASADLSLSLIPVEAPTPTSWERAWKGDVPLAVLFGQSPQGTFDATLRATLPPAFALHVAGEASPPPERLAEVTLEEQRFTATSTTGQRQPGLTAEQLATAIWTHALDSALSRPR